MTEFFVIRAGAGYDPLIVCEAEHKHAQHLPTAKYHEYMTWGASANNWREVSRNHALMGFSGHADGWGFAILPDRSFQSLEEVMAWVANPVYPERVSENLDFNLDDPMPLLREREPGDSPKVMSAWMVRQFADLIITAFRVMDKNGAERFVCSLADEMEEMAAQALDGVK